MLFYLRPWVYGSFLLIIAGYFKSECNIFLSDTKNNEFQSCVKSLMSSFLVKIEDFKGFSKFGGEMQGICEIKEALDVRLHGLSLVWKKIMEKWVN